MKQLLDEALGDVETRLALLLVDAARQAHHLRAGDAVEVRLQRADHRTPLPVPPLLDEPSKLLLDDRLGLGGLFRALRAMLARHLLQGVDVIEVDVAQLADRRLDVARNGDIQKAERTAAS